MDKQVEKRLEDLRNFRRGIDKPSAGCDWINSEIAQIERDYYARAWTWVDMKEPAVEYSSLERLTRAIRTSFIRLVVR